MKLSETMRRLHPVSQPSEQLTARIAAMAQVCDRNAQAPRLRRLPFVVAAGLAAAGIAGFALFVAPKRSLARTMEAVYANVRKARAVHYTISFADETFRCGTIGLTETENKIAELAVRQAKGTKRALQRGSGTVVIPVVYHVITNTAGVGGLTNGQIQAQIRVLDSHKSCGSA